ncbi:MAG: glycosyl transferase family 2 [Chlorobi bacterium]|nr:glycosyl transferase family 2 [Chlorobiota bacterium]
MQSEAGARPHVSVVMVSYNTRELTLAAIASVFDSIVEPGFGVEVIVVDNASHDGSADAVAARFPGITLIRSADNIGFGRGNNLGAKHATGDALFLLNTDTIVRAGAIETLYRTLFADPALGIVGPFLENADGSYQCSMTSFPSVWRTFCHYFWLDRLLPRSAFFADGNMAQADPLAPQDVDIINGAALMIRRDLYEAINGFDPDFFMYFEEPDLCRRVNLRGFRARYTPSARVIHLISQSSRSRMWWTHKTLRGSRMVYARKHMSAAERVALWGIVHVGTAIRIIIYPLIGLVKPRFGIMGLDMLKSYFPAGSGLTSRKNANA